MPAVFNTGGRYKTAVAADGHMAGRGSFRKYGCPDFRFSSTKESVFPAMGPVHKPAKLDVWSRRGYRGVGTDRRWYKPAQAAHQGRRNFFHHHVLGKDNR